MPALLWPSVGKELCERPQEVESANICSVQSISLILKKSMRSIRDMLLESRPWDYAFNFWQYFGGMVNELTA